MEPGKLDQRNQASGRGMQIGFQAAPRPRGNVGAGVKSVVASFLYNGFKLEALEVGEKARHRAEKT